ncbi:p53-like transcription factor [Violaceomyces palustris]|uniref:P53-like transcription factor n=1 Tax=Violaceomyces palustris TaxID=1673888 RepID=A0ACD0P3R5_9BASI|nr:p53-like transcription factor [Violaceomyces palustris]
MSSPSGFSRSHKDNVQSLKGRGSPLFDHEPFFPSVEQLHELKPVGEQRDRCSRWSGSHKQPPSASSFLRDFDETETLPGARGPELSELNTESSGRDSIHSCSLANQSLDHELSNTAANHKDSAEKPALLHVDDSEDLSAYFSDCMSEASFCQSPNVTRRLSHSVKRLSRNRHFEIGRDEPGNPQRDHLREPEAPPQASKLNTSDSEDNIFKTQTEQAGTILDSESHQPTIASSSYLKVDAAFSAHKGVSPATKPATQPYFLNESSDSPRKISHFSLGMSAHVSDSSGRVVSEVRDEVPLVQFGPARERGPREDVKRKRLEPGGVLRDEPSVNQQAAEREQTVASFRRVQIRSATLNNGNASKSATAQQYYVLRLSLYAHLVHPKAWKQSSGGSSIRVAFLTSEPITVRGRSKVHYAPSCNSKPKAPGRRTRSSSNRRPLNGTKDEHRVKPSASSNLRAKQSLITSKVLMSPRDGSGCPSRRVTTAPTSAQSSSKSDEDCMLRTPRDRRRGEDSPNGRSRKLLDEFNKYYTKPDHV